MAAILRLVFLNIFVLVTLTPTHLVPMLRGRVLHDNPSNPRELVDGGLRPSDDPMRVDGFLTAF